MNTILRLLRSATRPRRPVGSGITTAIHYHTRLEHWVRKEPTERELEIQRARITLFRWHSSVSK
jgi:hypothetical protein